jgi:hypothetical protein
MLGKPRDRLRKSSDAWDIWRCGMYAVVASVDITDGEVAMKALAEQVVPGVKQAPGFVAGYWIRLDEGHGTSVVVLETEEQARTGAPEVGGGSPGVTFTSVTVGEVVGHA